MRRVNFLMNYCLLANRAIALNYMMLRRLSPLLFAVLYEKITYPLLTRYPNVFITLKIVCRPIGCKPIDLGFSNFPIVLNLNYLQEVTLIFMS